MELLTVVVISTILLSLVLPALAKARRKAEGVYCTNNLRQIGVTATGMYTVDYDGYVMPAEMNEATGSWINYLYELENQKHPEMYACPVHKAEECFNPYGGKDIITEASYVMNTIAQGCWGAA